MFLLYTRPLYSSTCGTRFPIVVNFLSTPKKQRKKPDWSRRGGGSVMVWLLFYVILSEIYERAVNLYPPYLSLSSTYTGYPALYHYRWWTKAAAAAVTAHLQHIHLARNRSKALDQQPLDKVTALSCAGGISGHCCYPVILRTHCQVTDGRTALDLSSLPSECESTTTTRRVL